MRDPKCPLAGKNPSGPEIPDVFFGQTEVFFIFAPGPPPDRSYGGFFKFPFPPPSTLSNLNLAAMPKRIVGGHVAGGIRLCYTKGGDIRFVARIQHNDAATGKRRAIPRTLRTRRKAEKWLERKSDRLGLTKNLTWKHPTLAGVYVMALTQGKTTQFSKDHYPLLKEDTWFANFNPSAGAFYCRRSRKKDGKKRPTGMHRVILGHVDGPPPSRKHDPDHIGGSTTTLNNIRAPSGGSVDPQLNNLRWYVNSRNRKRYRTNTSGANGVSWDSRDDGWLARWYQGGKRQCESFAVRPRGNVDEAERQYRAAVAFRQARDVETGTQNGQRDA